MQNVFPLILYFNISNIYICKLQIDIIGNALTYRIDMYCNGLLLYYYVFCATEHITLFCVLSTTNLGS